MSNKAGVESLFALDRRAALARLGLGMAAAYAAPVLLKLSAARAHGSGGSGSGGSGNGGSGSGGSGASGGSASEPSAASVASVPSVSEPSAILPTDPSVPR